MHHSPVPVSAILVISLLILVVSVANPIFLLHFFPSNDSNTVAPKQNYTYIDDDWPELLPLDLPDVLMTMEESRHYSITGPDALEEWASTAARGFGYIQLGEHRRLFAVSMFHQFHCLRLMRYALEGRHDEGSRGHMQHCLTYLRQMILCHPDLTLEPANILEDDWDYEVRRVYGTHVCKDWTKVRPTARYRTCSDLWCIRFIQWQRKTSSPETRFRTQNKM
ncbi:hypothetical protein VKT23_000608 [Stygiomarasmius scandens]|uniref:Oxidase ustYa n=1 Tax=Marasmiellus scandens TaxID=2682957 RepID=A0ABR1K4X4_9AGAR